jgi:predicted extracellular nuclease
MRTNSARVRAVVGFVLLIAFGLLFGLRTANASSNGVVISQVYGGGGNSGSTFKNDFIEIFNSSPVSVDLTGWSVQYASAAGTSWQVTALSGPLASGQYYLIQESQGAAGTTPLPTPNATGNIAMSATAGKVALLSTTTALSGSCPVGGAIVDFIGYGAGSGGASCFEGVAAAPTLTNTTADLRKNNGAQDTDNNSADFATGAPNPRNSTVSANIPTGIGHASPSSVAAGGGTLLTVVVTPGAAPTSTGISVVVDLSSIGGPSTQSFFDDGSSGDVTANDNTFSFTATVTASTAAGVRNLPVSISDAQGRSSTTTIPFTVTAAPLQLEIHDIQGTTEVSPFAGKLVSTTGIVTAVSFNGFFIQAPDNAVDSDPNTPEGIFVFTSKAPSAAAAVGNLVQVTGTVNEFVPGSDPNSPPSTEIGSSPATTLLSTGNPLPTPVTLAATDTNPEGAFDELQKFKAMRVHIDTLHVTAATGGTVDEPDATATSNGVFFGVLPGIARPFREPGVQVPDPLPAGSPANVPRWDHNPELIRVDSGALPGSSKLDVTAGATATGLTGPLDFGSRYYTILTEPSSGAAATGNLTATPVPVPASSELTIGNFNMEHFYDTVDDPNTSDSVLTPTAFGNRLNKASLAIRNVMNSPDILGVEEMENLATLQALADQVNSDTVAAGLTSPGYTPYLSAGNDPSGINLGFLVKSRVNVSGVQQVGKDATFAEPSGATGQLNDRPPLVLTATVAQPNSDVSLPVTVVLNHLRSLLNIDDPSEGPFVRAKRQAQAEFVANLLQQHQAAGENVVQLCDCNAFEFNDGYVDVLGIILGKPAPPDEVVNGSPDLVDPALTDLVSTLPQEQRYTFVETGSAQTLDHVLVSGSMLSRLTRFAIARNNADFPEAFRGDPTRPERVSDHDMPVAYFSLPEASSPALHLPADITAEATGPGGAAVTYAVTVTDAVDATVPFACTPASGSLFPFAVTTVSCTATNSRNKTASGSFHVKVADTIAPFVTASATVNGAAYTPGRFTNQVVVVSFACTDSGSGVATFTAPISLSAEGINQSVSGSCTDNAGNIATATFSGINIDRTPPNPPEISLTPAPNAAGWNNTSVVASFVANGDAGGVPSGIAGCTAPLILTAETAATAVTGNCIDVAGNTGPSASTTVKIDKTAPAVSVLGVSNGAIYLLGAAPAPSCSSSDALSGLAVPATLNVTGGSPNHTGTFTATCSGATDVAGNVSAPVSVTFSVRYVFKELFPIHPDSRVTDVPDGFVVPVVWTLQDSAGRFVTNLNSVRSVQIGQNATCVAGGEGPASNASSLDNRGVQTFLQAYAFNLSTHGLQRGCYSILIALDDDTVKTSVIRLL